MKNYLSRHTLFLLLLLCGLSGCFLFPRGHLQIPAAVRSDYEAGIALYNNGHYAEAEQRFRAVLDTDSRAVMARYWLGLSLVAQQELSSARRQFQQITALSRKAPYGYHGLGLVALQQKHRKFEALEWFRRALAADPSFVDAQWQLALTRLALSRGIFGAFSMGSIRQEFERVIEMDPKHPEAYYILGSTYYEYGKLDDANTAIPYFERQVAANPEHYEARYQLGLAYIDVERIEEGIAALDAVRHINPMWEPRINQAIAEAQLRNALVSADSVFIVLKLLPEQERRLYLDLRPVLPPGQGMDVGKTPLDEAEAAAGRHWKSQDPTPATPDNPRWVEHCRRVAYARRYFGRGLWPWDRRGEVYIRYGDPDSRDVYTADVSTGSPSDLTGGGTGAAPQFGIRQVERWVYLAPPLEFEFIDQGSNFVFDTPLMSATGDIGALAEEAMYDPGAVADEMAARTPAVYVDAREQGPPLRFSYSLAAFRGADGQPELEVDYAVPARDLMFEERRALLETAIAVFDSAWAEVSKAVDQQQLNDTSSGASRNAQVAMYRRVIQVPAGQEYFTIQVTDRQSGRTGLVRQPVVIQAYAPGQLALSDIRLVSAVRQDTSGLFVRGGRQLVPNPPGVFSPGRPLSVYFEIYNLQRAPDERTALTIEYTVFPLSGSSRPVLSVADQSRVHQAEGREFALIQDEQGTEDTLYRDISIELGNAEPGRYALQVAVTDHNRGETVDKTVVFRFVR